MRNTSCTVVCVLLCLCLLPACAQEAPAAAADMRPTDCALTGVFDAYLYVPLEGGVYRYERVDGPAAEASKGKRIFSFEEDSGFAQYGWQVYTVKEYPDLSHVWAESGADYAALYRYSPPKRAAEGALENARAEGCAVMEDGDVTGGQDIWQAFVEETEKGNAASVRVAHYYTLDPARCDPAYYAAYSEDYPALYIHELSYDGMGYILRWEENGERIERSYRYLMRYEGEASTAQAGFDTYLRYVLTNDSRVTWEDLTYGMVSSRFGDYIDHFSIYTDLQRKEEQASPAEAAAEGYGVFVNGKAAYPHFLWESSYTEHGWLAADGISLAHRLPEIAAELPEARFEGSPPSVEVHLEDSGAAISGINVYDAAYAQIHSHITEEAFGALCPALAPGEYYIACTVVSTGRCIGSEKECERRGEAYLYKLIIPKEEIG